MRYRLNPRRVLVAIFAVVASFAANATDYYWTGGANDGGLWSTAANWALDAEGATPADAAPATGERATCHFDVPAAGLVVSQDTGARIVISNLIVTTSSTEPVEMKIVSPAKGSEFEFSPGGEMTVGTNATLVLNTDMSTSGSRETIRKFGDGTLAFDLVFASPASPRPVVVYAGRVVVLSTSQDVRHAVRLAGTDAAHPPVYENRRDGGLYQSLEVPGEGSIQLNGTTMKVGDKVDSNLKVTTANTIPNVIDSGTLSFANEHSYMLATNQLSYNIELDRADVTYAPETIMGMQFEDAASPQKDNVGLGYRLVSIGEPQVVNDAGRGNVLSLDGSSGFKGPDADNGLAEFNPNDGFTLSLWLKPAATCDSEAKIFFFGQGWGTATSVALRFHNDANKLFYSQFGGNTQIPTSGIHDGNWHHVAIVYNGDKNYNFFYDGAQVHTWTPNDALNVPNRDFFIGHVSASYASASSSYKNGANPYTGQIDDFFLSNRALASSEIADIYSNGIAAYSKQLAFQSVSAKSAGALLVPASASIKTISGAALSGGIEMGKPGSTLTVGTGAGEANTVFQGTVAGTDSTLVKAGGDYALTLAGAVKGVTNVVVNEGSLALYRPARPRRGLVCRYSFDDDSDFGKDDGPAGFDLTKGDDGTPTATVGVENGAVNFPEVENGYVYFSASAGDRPSNFPTGNGSFTISAWIRPTPTACSSGSVICCWGGGGNGKMVMLRFNGGSTAIMFVSSGTDYNLNVSGLPNLADGQWHHIVATYDGEANYLKKFYCDGVIRGVTNIVRALDVNPADYAFEIGHSEASSSNATKRYRGGMDEFMVFDYAWTAEEVAAEYNSVPVPAPTAHWTFDGEDPLADTTGNYPLEAFRANDAQPNVTFESGDYICGKAARFTSTSGCLRRETFPEGVIPSGSTEFTLVVRYRPDTTQPSAYVPRVVGWGTTGEGELFALGTEASDVCSVRAMLSDSKSGTTGISGMDRTAIGSDHTRWYTVALTYDKAKLRIYVDGTLALTQTSKVAYSLVGSRFVIGSSFVNSRDFYGLVDDVQIYNRALTAGQVRQVAEQLEASKGKAATSTVTPAGVLRDAPDVTVASDSTLKIASTENVGNLSGAGTVELSPIGRLNVSSVNGFAGTVTGDGLVGVADNAVVEFGDGSQPLLVLDRPLALGSNVTVNTTVHAGKHLIARATSFLDADNLASWTATVGGREYRFAVSTDGTELYLLMRSGLMLILR